MGSSSAVSRWETIIVLLGILSMLGAAGYFATRELGVFW